MPTQRNQIGLSPEMIGLMVDWNDSKRRKSFDQFCDAATAELRNSILLCCIRKSVEDLL